MISVVVPYKNSAKWLRRCLDSLTSQTGDFEFLIVNDHSDDKGPMIAESYTDDRFRLLDNERGAGVSGARNTGMDHARGEWIAFLDADDEMLPGAWEIFEEVLETDANIHQLNHRRRTRQRDAMKFSNNGGVYGLDAMPDAWWGVWNKLFRAEFVKNIRFDEDLQYGEDGMFVLECLAKDGRIHHAEHDLATTRHRFDNPKSLSKTKTGFDLVKQAKAYVAFLDEHPEMCRVIAVEMVKIWERALEKFTTSSTS